MLPLTFSNIADYDRLKPDDRISLLGLSEFAPEWPVSMVVDSQDGKWETILNHTFNQEQIAYFRAGSALNLMALKRGGGEDLATSRV